jgi:hypothetical protein
MGAKVRLTRLDRQADDSWLLAFGAEDTETFEQLIAAVKSLPMSARTWDDTAKAWWVRIRFWLQYLARKVPVLSLEEALATYESSSSTWSASTILPTVPRDVSHAFGVLHLTTDAPADLIKSAFRLAARRAHPDVPGGNHLAMLDLQAVYYVALGWAEEHEEVG